MEVKVEATGIPAVTPAAAKKISLKEKKQIKKETVDQLPQRELPNLSFVTGSLKFSFDNNK